MLMVTVVVDVLPAWSTAWPVALWVAPSVVSTGELEQPAMPETWSLQEKKMATSVLFQPWPLLAGYGVPMIVGGVLSSLTMRVAVVLLPALS
jgi:hypothetical protein